MLVAARCLGEEAAGTSISDPFSDTMGAIDCKRKNSVLGGINHI